MAAQERSMSLFNAASIFYFFLNYFNFFNFQLPVELLIFQLPKELLNFQLPIDLYNFQLPTDLLNFLLSVELHRFWMASTTICTQLLTDLCSVWKINIYSCPISFLVDIMYDIERFVINSLWLSDGMLQHRYWSTLAQVMACCLMAPSHYLNQCWLIMKGIWWCSHESPLDIHKINLKILLLTHWGRVTHICVGNLTIIGSDNGLSPGRRQAIIWTNAGILLIGPLGTNFSEILIRIQTFSFKKMHLKMSSAKWLPFCSDLNVLKLQLVHLPGTKEVIHRGLMTGMHKWSGSSLVQVMALWLLCIKSLPESTLFVSYR